MKTSLAGCAGGRRALTQGHIGRRRGGEENAGLLIYGVLRSRQLLLLHPVDELITPLVEI